jgi:hypothetical protein
MACSRRSLRRTKEGLKQKKLKEKEKDWSSKNLSKSLKKKKMTNISSNRSLRKEREGPKQTVGGT